MFIKSGKVELTHYNFDGDGVGFFLIMMGGGSEAELIVLVISMDYLVCNRGDGDGNSLLIASFTFGAMEVTSVGACDVAKW